MPHHLKPATPEPNKTSPSTVHEFAGRSAGLRPRKYSQYSQLPWVYDCNRLAAKTVCLPRHRRRRHHATDQFFAQSVNSWPIKDYILPSDAGARYLAECLPCPCMCLTQGTHDTGMHGVGQGHVGVAVHELGLAMDTRGIVQALAGRPARFGDLAGGCQSAQPGQAKRRPGSCHSMRSIANRELRRFRDDGYDCWEAQVVLDCAALIQATLLIQGEQGHRLG